jgi:hypothetical protein
MAKPKGSALASEFRSMSSCPAPASCIVSMLKACTGPLMTCGQHNTFASMAVPRHKTRMDKL